MRSTFNPILSDYPQSQKGLEEEQVFLLLQGLFHFDSYLILGIGWEKVEVNLYAPGELLETYIFVFHLGVRLSSLEYVQSHTFLRFQCLLFQRSRVSVGMCRRKKFLFLREVFTTLDGVLFVNSFCIIFELSSLSLCDADTSIALILSHFGSEK